MAYRYRRVIAEKAEEESLLRDELFRIYNCVNSTRSASDLLHRRAASLADKSKAHFAAAVRLDEQLKELTENDTSEGKD